MATAPGLYRATTVLRTATGVNAAAGDGACALAYNADMTDLLNTREAAAELGVSNSTVQKLCQGPTPIGRLVTPRQRVLTRADVRRLAHILAGRIPRRPRVGGRRE